MTSTPAQPSPSGPALDLSSASSSSSDNSSSEAERPDDDDNNDDDESDDEAVADALVGARKASAPDFADRSMAPPPPSSLFDGSSTASDDESDHAPEEGDEVEHVSDIEEAVLECVDEADDVGADETLPFDFGSASERDSDNASDAEVADDGMAQRRARKRRRVDSAAGGDDSRTTSRAGSPEDAFGPSDESMFISHAVAPALAATVSTSTPARLGVAVAHPHATDSEREVEEGEEPEEGEVVQPDDENGVILPDEISAALSALRAASTADDSIDMVETGARQPVVVATAAPPVSTGPPVPKASYERKRVDLGSLDSTPPPNAPASKRFKLSYKPSPLSL